MPARKAPSTKRGAIRCGGEGPMSTRKGQAASVTLLRREQLRSASAPTKSIVDSPTSIRRKSRARLWSIEGVRGNHPKGFPGRLFPFLIGTERRPSTAVGFREGRRRLRMWRFRRPGESGTEQPSSDADTVLFFLRIEKEKNGVAKPRSLYIFRRVCYNKTSF